MGQNLELSESYFINNGTNFLLQKKKLEERSKNELR